MTVESPEAQSAAARPWPQANPRLIGHSQAERQLLESWAEGRLPAGLLLEGPTGIGKATLAYRFARFLFYYGTAADVAAGGLFGAQALPESLQVPEDSALFRRVASGGHSDLLSVARPAGARSTAELPVQQIRAVPGFLHQTAGEGGWRIVVIDDAETMNKSAANALLKVLEEPPQQALLILVAHAPGRLPATIRSRCRRLALRPLEPGELAERLAGFLPEHSAEQRGQLAQLAQGRLGLALQLADQDGAALAAALESLLNGLPHPDWREAEALADRLGARQNDAAFALFCDLLNRWQAALLRRLAGSGDTGGEPAVFADSLARHAARGRLESWLAVWDKINDLIRAGDDQYLDRKQVILQSLALLASAAAHAEREEG